MSIATTTSPVGTTWSNVISEETIQHLLFDQTSAPTISPDKHVLTFTLRDGTISLHASDAFSFSPMTGTIDGFTTSDTTVTGLSIALGDFMLAMHDGDFDAINQAVWGRADTITGGASDDLIRGFGGSDTMRGGAGKDTLIGDSGNDRLYGGDGDDLLLGGTGSDRLYGERGNDQLSGGAGDDVLSGGVGADSLNGGSGADKFTWSGYTELTVPSADFRAMDVIRDFNRIDGDRIDLSVLDANRGLTGDQAFSFIGNAAFGTGTPGQIRVVPTPIASVYQIQINSDNDAQADYAIMVVSLSGSLQAGDFVL